VSLVSFFESFLGGCFEEADEDELCAELGGLFENPGREPDGALGEGE